MVGATGPIKVTVNEATVYESGAAAARAGASDSEVVRCSLSQGRNRILIFVRQGNRDWSYSVQIAPLAKSKTDEKAAVASAPETRDSSNSKRPSNER